MVLSLKRMFKNNPFFRVYRKIFICIHIIYIYIYIDLDLLESILYIFRATQTSICSTYHFSKRHQTARLL